jgi:hypothetical protein
MGHGPGRRAAGACSASFLFHSAEAARYNVPMLKSVEGIFRNGKVELLEAPSGVEGARVVVTFLPTHGSVDLAERGIDASQVGDLRAMCRKPK